MVTTPHTFRNDNFELLKGSLEFRMEFALNVTVRA